MATVDTVLIARMALGDHDAAGELYDRYAARLYSLALHICHDPGSAEEVVQDVFLAAWRAARRYDHRRGSVPAWLFTLARNRAIDRLRAQGRRPEVAWEPVAASAASESGVDRTVENRVLAAQARRLMETLPAKYREPLQLAYFGGLTQREIAEAMGLPLGTVKTRIRMALNHLRQGMQAPSTFNEGMSQ